MARSWIGVISPKGVLAYAEEDARGVFQSGKAIFMRNWPYAWALANADDSPVRGKVGVAPLPRGAGPSARSAATLGGQQLAVSRYSAHIEEAVDLARSLTSAEEQKRRALQGSFNPTRPALYSDGELLKANPFYADFLQVLQSAVPRASAATGRRYNRVSYEIVQSIHDALSGRGSPEENLSALQRALTRQQRDGAWR
jgi:trehalose/maltose transport system substrate-binding protein